MKLKKQLTIWLTPWSLLLSLLVSVAPATALQEVRLVPLDAGGSTTCALRSGNDVYCVGENSLGQLGDLSLSDKSEPVFSQVSGAQAVSVGNTSACAIGSDQKGYCWGSNAKGQLGNAQSGNQARKISLDVKLVDISVGDGFACAVTIESKLYCWGEFTNNSGTLSSATPSLIQISGVKSVSVGKAAVCAITTDVYCFGSLVSSNEFTKIDRSLGATQVSVGDNFACVLVAGTVRCLGNNSQGQLGLGHFNASNSVTDVVGITDAKSITAGAQHACALSLTGSTYCWGDNSASQITSGTSDQATRVPVSLGTPVAITNGDLYTCGLNQDGTVKCLGDSSSGQSAYLASSTSPIGSSSASGQVQVSTGNETTCIISQAGKLNCFGEIVPEVDSAQSFSQVVVGNVSACAISVSGDIFCWGSNSSGQLGDNTNRTSVIPVKVLGTGNRKAISVSAGYRHFCAAMDDGLVMCWGDNSKDQLGFTGVDSKTATPVPGIGNATAVSVGDYHSCALLTTKRVMCWGDNSKKQITAEASLKYQPTQVALSKEITKVSSGGFNTCYLFTDKSVSCYGDNSELQAVENITGSFRDVVVGNKTVCLILDSNKSLQCLGSNTSNRLGRIGLRSSTPVDFSLSVELVSVGLSHACALSSNSGSLKCWGSNSLGQLGESYGFPSAFNQAVVSVTGPINVGEQITANVSSIDPGSTLEYSWYRSTEANGSYSKINGQVDKVLSLTASDQGRYFKSYVVVQKFGISSKQFKSSAIGPIGKQTRLLKTPLPKISGTAKVGKILLVKAGTWDAGTQFSYQWYRGSSKIAGETKASYRLAASDLGKQVSVTVTGFKAGYPKVIVKSAKTLKVTR